jgi:tape measure domain-containing protein
MATAIGNLFIRIGADTKKLDADLKAAQRRLKSSAKEFKSIGADLSQTVSLPIIAIGAGAVKAFGDLEALQKGLISVMGSAEAAGREFTKLKEVAKLPGLGLEEAVRGSVNLQSAGFSADQAREALLQFGNALATVGKGKNELNLVVLALTQLQNKSSGFGQDLRQLVEQLPQLRGALTNAFGTADSEAIANLGVTGKQVVETLITEFGKLPRVSGGIKNAFENLSDSTKIAFANLGEALNKSLNIEGLLNRISNFVTKAAEAFSRLSPGTQKAIVAIAGLTAAIGPLLFIGGQLAGSFSAIIAAMKTVGLTATVSLGPVGVAVAAIAAAATILYLKWEDIREVMDQIGVSSINLSGIFDALADAVGLLITNARLVIDVLGNLIGTYLRLSAVVAGKISWEEFKTSTVDAFKETGTRAAQGFSDAFNEEAKKGGTTNRGGAFIRPNQSSSAASSPLSLTPKASGKKVNQFSELPEDVAIKAGLQAGGLSLPFTGELPKLNAFPAAIDSKVLQPLKSVGNELKGIKDSMSQTFKDTFESATDFAARQLQKVVDKLTEANDAIQSGLSQVGSILGPALQVTSQLLDNQSVALDNRQAKEKAQVLATVKNEDEKAKRLAEIDKKYAAEKAKLQRKQAIQNKIAGIFNAIVATFEGVARALALGPAGIPLIPFIKGLGLANVAAIAAAPLPSLAIGTNRVNRSGLAEIHRGEAIVPADVVQGGFTGGGNFVENLMATIEGHVIRVSQRNSEFLSSRLIA